MFSDAENYPHETLDADICIIGAGPAGITLAKGFLGSNIRVVILESGGRDFERKSQRLAKGVNAGVHYEALDLCRVRKFGGSTGKFGWGGWCKPLADIDFSERPWFPMSGWPITRQELEPFYLRALETLQLPSTHPFDTDLAENRASEDKLDLSDSPLTVEESLLAPATGHCLSDAYDDLAAADNIHVLLHATVTEIVSAPLRNRVTGVNVKSLSGRSFSVSARWIVLAAGGIENPRIMLQSTREHPKGIGNDRDLVGRCFMENPRFHWGRLSGDTLPDIVRQFYPANAVRRRLSQASSNEVVSGLGFMIRPEIQREEQLLNARTWIYPAPAASEGDGGRELRETVFWLKKSRMPDAPIRRAVNIFRDLPNALRTTFSYLRPSTHWEFVTVMEQEPVLNSRVMLDNRRDALGQQAVRLEWRLGPLVERTLRRNQEVLVDTLSRRGINCSAVVPGASKSELELARWVWHHMGTTRMSHDPAQGVVDEDCRVHGFENLYVTGSSVFPTGGNDMPTLTIVALAHRLSDHLKHRVTRSQEPATLKSVVYEMPMRVGSAAGS
ncbi:FAD-dependent oxidoreductase [Microvirga solisilvae]|uniref:FAD-dependent oxidoreductase n=1 Tax=Microvirga solisilvae TaxID=2919498 RepID=UPI001FAF16FD|nr:GMC family oxidoreductase [Microvirga solisilvae]